MSALTEHLARLEACLRRNPDVPTWNAIRLVDRDQVQPGSIVSDKALLTVEEYESRFETLMAAGYSWINLSALGVYRGDLLVRVELPRASGGIPPGRTSVNLSGPTMDAKTLALVWDASAVLTIVD